MMLPHGALLSGVRVGVASWLLWWRDGVPLARRRHEPPHALTAGEGGIPARRGQRSGLRPGRRTGTTPYAPRQGARRDRGKRTTGHRAVAAAARLAVTSTVATRREVP